ncbi:unnamed protein product [Ectocarpus sp. CCAP 1310/34]|nr:unnamed protein product [Ectocarpus sp. CCAP 1310/34]
MSICLPTSTLRNRPAPASTGCTSSVHSEGPYQARVLQCTARYSLNSSVVCACKLSMIRMDLALGSSPRPRIRPSR